MAGHTTKFNLTKPAASETADIGVINTNMDLLDAAIPVIYFGSEPPEPGEGETIATGSLWLVPIVTEE